MKLCPRDVMLVLQTAAMSFQENFYEIVGR